MTTKEEITSEEYGLYFIRWVCQMFGC